MANIYEARNVVNSLFGTYTVAQDTGIATWDDVGVTNANVYDKLLRGKDSIQTKIKQSDKIVNALADPTGFIYQRLEDLSRIAGLLKTEFERSFQVHASRNIPMKNVRENVKKDVDELYDKLMMFHNQDFPTDILQRIVKKLVGGN